MLENLENKNYIKTRESLHLPLAPISQQHSVSRYTYLYIYMYTYIYICVNVYILLCVGILDPRRKLQTTSTTSYDLPLARRRLQSVLRHRAGCVPRKVYPCIEPPNCKHTTRPNLQLQAGNTRKPWVLPPPCSSIH